MSDANVAAAWAQIEAEHGTSRGEAGGQEPVSGMYVGTITGIDNWMVWHFYDLGSGSTDQQTVPGSS